jgi:imidazole glycerol-phosphate synthase subunit HisH
MIITIFDYGVGNLHSLAKALEAGGATVRVESDPAELLRGDALVLPGVGAFGAAAARLAPALPILRPALAAGHPALGICLGMQLLFQASEEGEGHGLGIFPGVVRRLRTPRSPHIGWNEVMAGADPLFAGLSTMEAYFANGYVAAPDEPASIVAWTEYDGHGFPSAVRSGATVGVQFHPEKSGAAGLRLLRNFLAGMRR